MKRFPLILAIVLYILIYLLRQQQGGWDLKFDLLQSQRHWLDEKISQFVPSPSAELLSGILLGQNKNLPGDLRLALRDSSTLHMVVASGQNLSIMAGFLLALSGFIKRRVAIFLTFGAVIFYTLLAGAQVPILRAGFMFSLSALAQIFGRKGDSVRILFITAGFFLLLNPDWISDLSFQLSFLATFGVVAVAPVLLERFRNLPLIGQDLAVTLSAQIMVLPVIVQNFHQISLVSLLANIMVLWTIPFIMIGGFLMLILGSLFSFAGTVSGMIVNILLAYFIYTVKFFAQLPFAWEYAGEKHYIFWIGYYLVVASVVLLLRNVKREDSDGFKGGGF